MIKSLKDNVKVSLGDEDPLGELWLFRGEERMEGWQKQSPQTSSRESAHWQALSLVPAELEHRVRTLPFS